MIIRILPILLIAFLAACGGSSNSECRYGEPQPIFPSDNSQLVGHRFMQNGQDATESFRLPDGTAVEIYQSGCDEISQEFRFLHQTEEADLSPPMRAVDYFNRLSEVASDPILFSQYANAIRENADLFAPGTTVQLDAGFFLAVEMVPMGSQSVLSVTFSSAAPE